MASTLYCDLETLLCRGILEESIIRTCHECGIEKFIQGISVWYHKACQVMTGHVMTNGDSAGQITHK